MFGDSNATESGSSSGSAIGRHPIAVGFKEVCRFCNLQYCSLNSDPVR
jgi:hypothetical protein